MTWPTVPFSEAIGDVSAGNKKIPLTQTLKSRLLPVIDQGRRFIAGYTDDDTAAVNVNGPVIVFGDHTRALKYVDFRFAMGADGTKLLQVRDGFDSRFVFRFLGSVELTGLGYSRHFKALKETRIPRPPIEEQRRIAAILDAADAVRAKRRAQLALLDELVESLFQSHVLAAPRRLSLRALGVDFVAGKNIVSDGRSPHSSNRVLKVSAVSSRQFRAEETKPMPADYVAPTLHRVHRGDILFGRASGSLDLLGATAVVDADVVDVYLPDKVWRLEVPPESGMTREFVLGVLRSAEFLRFIRHHASGAAGVRNIAKSKVLDYMAPIPPIAMQYDYSRKHVAILIERTRVADALGVEDELFAALQYRAFRGEL